MSPLIRRIPRQLKAQAGKYLGVFVLIAFTVAFVSGFLNTSSSIMRLTSELPEKYNLEDGRVTLTYELSDRQVEAAEKGEFSWLDRLTMSISGDDSDLGDYEGLRLYELFSRDMEAVVPNDPVVTDRAINMRVYKAREEVDLAALHEGELPASQDEIAIDITFARNHGLKEGSSIEIAGRSLKVCGLVTLPDYTTLFEKNTDFIMDDFTFCVGLMTQEGYDSFSDYAQDYTYAYLFDDCDLSLAERTSAEEKLVKALSLAGASVTDLIDVDDNQGVNFAVDDAEGDSNMYRVFFYVIVVVMAFIFVVITGATIEQEASAIGTLLASGLGKGALVRHYLALPMIVAVLAAVVGNLCQGFFVNWSKQAYYNSYSLPPFVLNLDTGIFIQTSVLPVLLLFVITYIGLAKKLKHTPLAFLRHEISRSHKGRGVTFPHLWPFFTRFRLRVLINNAGSMVTIFLGIFISGVLLLMGIGMLPLVRNMAEQMADSLPVEHLYTLRGQIELEEGDEPVADQAEKVELASLQTVKKWNSGSMKTSVYGIEPQSAYWEGYVSDPSKVSVGSGFASVCDKQVGDTVLFTDPYNDMSFEVEVGSVVGSTSDMSVYMDRGSLNLLLGNDEDDFNAWASDAELHFEDTDVASCLTPDDMAKIADQLENSMGNVMSAIVVAAMVVFIVVIYLLSKTVVERASKAVSQLKVFGYREGEVSRVYIRAITVCVAISLGLSMPLILLALSGLFDVAFLAYNIALDLDLPASVYVEYYVLGLACYIAVALLNKLHLRRVSLALALKSQE